MKYFRLFYLSPICKFGVGLTSIFKLGYFVQLTEFIGLIFKQTQNISDNSSELFQRAVVSSIVK